MSRMHAELPYREVHDAPLVESTEPEHRSEPEYRPPVEEKAAPSSNGSKLMARRILTIVAVLAFIGLIYLVYQRWVAARANNSGTVQLLGDPDTNSKVVVDRAEMDRLHAAEDKQATANTTVTTQTTVPAAQPRTAMAVPTSDSIPANPTNGMVYAGTGKYQLYRQGSITWRLDTDTGHACIIFATDEQWRLQRVYSHGCGSN